MYSYSGFLLVRLSALAHQLEVCASVIAGQKGPATYTRYFALGMQLSPALQSLFSFHIGCGYDARRYLKKKRSYKFQNLSSTPLTSSQNSEMFVNVFLFSQIHILNKFIYQLVLELLFTSTYATLIV